MLLNTIVEVLLAYILLIITVCCGLALVWIQAFGIEVEDGWRKFPGKYVEKDWIANRFRMNAEGFSLATILWILLLLVTGKEYNANTFSDTVFMKKKNYSNFSFAMALCFRIMFLLPKNEGNIVVKKHSSQWLCSS